MSSRLIACCAGAVMLAALPASAQSDVDHLRRQYDAVDARRAEVGTQLNEVRRRNRDLYDDSVQIGARRVAFSRAQLTDADLALIGRVLRAESERLREQFGANAEAFADSARWGLHADRTRFRRRLMLQTVRRDGRAVHLALSVPLDSAELAQMARTSAATAVAELHPRFASFVKGEISLDTGSAVYARAAQTLALGGSTLGERCLAGALSDCRTVLDPQWDRPALDLFYEQRDYVELVRRRARPSAARSAEWTRRRSRCVDEGDVGVCESLLREMQLGWPFREELRGSFALHALFLGGEKGVDRAREAGAAAQSDAIAYFAFVAGVSEDELLRSWRAHVVASRAVESKRPMLPVMLSSFGWAAILGAWATRRRSA